MEPWQPGPRQVKEGGKATGSCLQLGQLLSKERAAAGFWGTFENSEFQQTRPKAGDAECSCSTWEAGKGSASFPGRGCALQPAKGSPKGQLSADDSFLMPADAARARGRCDTAPRARMQLAGPLGSILPLKADLGKGNACFNARMARIDASACRRGRGRSRRQADPRPCRGCSRFSGACRHTCPQSRDAVFPPLGQCRSQQLPAAAKRYF